MLTSYPAYGMHLRCSFPLPGMSPREIEGLPPLSLQLTTPAELSRGWSGSDHRPAWRGRLGDGEVLTLDHGEAGDVLFGYGRRAYYLLDAQMSTLLCAPVQLGLDWQRVLCTKVLAAISVILGYEALHAGVVESPEGVVAIAASSGAGKSTLVLELMRRGWRLFSDDVLTFESVEGTVRAHPGTPHMNLDANLPDDADLHVLGRTLGVLSGERWLVTDAGAIEPRPIRMVCLLDRGADHDALQVERVPANSLLLAPYRLGLQADRRRERSRFHVYADLMKSATLVRVRASLERTPEEIAQGLERALADQRLVGGGVG